MRKLVRDKRKDKIKENTRTRKIIVKQVSMKNIEKKVYLAMAASCRMTSGEEGRAQKRTRLYTGRDEEAVMADCGSAISEAR